MRDLINMLEKIIKNIKNILEKRENHIIKSKVNQNRNHSFLNTKKVKLSHPALMLKNILNRNFN